jgi:hypothetical protein
VTSDRGAIRADHARLPDGKERWEKRFTFRRLTETPPGHGS